MDHGKDKAIWGKWGCPCWHDKIVDVSCAAYQPTPRNGRSHFQPDIWFRSSEGQFRIVDGRISFPIIAYRFSAYCRETSIPESFSSVDVSFKSSRSIEFHRPNFPDATLLYTLRAQKLQCSSFLLVLAARMVSKVNQRNIGFLNAGDGRRRTMATGANPSSRLIMSKSSRKRGKLLKSSIKPQVNSVAQGGQSP